MLVWGERFKYTWMRLWIDKEDIYSLIDISAGNKSFVQRAWLAAQIHCTILVVVVVPASRRSRWTLMNIQHTLGACKSLLSFSYFYHARPWCHVCFKNTHLLWQLSQNSKRVQLQRPAVMRYVRDSRLEPSVDKLRGGYGCCFSLSDLWLHQQVWWRKLWNHS